MAPLKILLVEDSHTDAELALRELHRDGIVFTAKRVETEHDFRKEFAEFKPDLIISDYSMPHFDGLTALHITQQEFPDIPFVFVSGTIGEETAIRSLKEGAVDYILKNNLLRLPASVRAAMQRSAEQSVLRAAQKNLDDSNRLFQVFMENLPGAAYIKDEAGRYIYANKAKADASSVTLPEIISKTDSDLLPDDLASFLNNMDTRVQEEKIAVQEIIHIPSDEGGRYWLTTRFPLGNIENDKDRIGGIAIDITDQKAAEAALLIRNQAIEVSPLPVLIVDVLQPGMPLIYVNSAFEKVTGYSKSEAIGRNSRFLQGADNDQPELEKIRAAIREHRTGSALLRNYKKDGTLFLNELYIAPVLEPGGDLIHHYVGIQNDVTQIKRYQSDLERQANYDELTGLANRNLLQERLHQAIIQGDRYSHHFTVAFIDIDNFKLINDSLGHAAGDKLVAIFGKRLLECVRDGDTVARIGGDEFVVLLTEQSYMDSDHRVIKRIQSEIAKPFEIKDKELTVTCSMGLSTYPRDGHDSETLLANADVAMYRAKSKGRNTFQFYSKDMNAKMGERLSLKNDLWRALDNNEFILHYQPQLNLTTGRIVGIEALIRWIHPSLGLIPPLEFIPMAEEDGLIVPIGEWAMRMACKQNLELQESGFEPIRVAVNLSARQLGQTDLIKVVHHVLDSSGLDPKFLELEITESMVMHNVEEVISLLNEINNIGVQLSLDDFGTGYSSLSYLKRFPINRLKIDRSFVRDIVTDSNDATIAQSIIALAHSLQVDVVAEGIETEEQLQFLKLNNCDIGQGYYFSKPISFGDLTKLLAKQIPT